MRLLILLAVLSSFDEHGVAEGLKYTNTWAMQIDANVTEAPKIAGKYGFTFEMKISANYYLFKHKNLPRISSKPSSFPKELLKDPLVKWFAQQIRQKNELYDKHFPALSFNDPRWNDLEWYLGLPDNNKGMNIYQVWQQGITGKGVVVAVVDEGLQQSHPELADNYDPLASLDLIDFDATPDPVGNNSGHGNRCGGIIAAAANNSKCGVGVAFNAKLGGIRLFEDEDFDPTDAMVALALQHNRQHIDIYSCSWGPEDTGWSMEGPEKLTRDQLEEGTKIGRQGKGSIFVFASGNGGRAYDNCAYNGYVNSIFTIAISGVNRNGSIPGYAERCSAIMASTYSQDDLNGKENTVTSDLNGTCTATFSATSVSASIASGIIALALEANPRLTWRDVQHLIAYSSNSSVPRSDDWIQNAAGLWVSSYFGFGLMDAAALVNYSRSWRTVPKQIKCQITERNVHRAFRQYIEVNLTVSNRTCNQEGKINYLEHVVVILHARFDRRGYLEGFLTSPNGTTSQILPYRANDVIASDFNEWPILSMHFWGEDPQGDWRLRLQSRYPNYKFSGYLMKWSIIFYGMVSNPLETNLHVPIQFSNRTSLNVTTEAATDDITEMPHKPAGITRNKGMTGTAIALIASAVFFALAVVCAVILVKCGVVPCCQKTASTKLTEDTTLSEQSAPLKGVDSCGKESIL
ncbi:hypothetical protein ABFA07_003268 [Porites harrisoni]